MKSEDFVLAKPLTRGIGCADSGPCPALEEIAALVDGTVDGAGRDTLMSHLASCPKCRNTFVTSSRLSREEATAAERLTRWRFVIPSAFAAAAVLVVAISLTFKGSPTVSPQVVAKTEQPPAAPMNAAPRHPAVVAKSDDAAVANEPARRTPVETMAQVPARGGEVRSVAALQLLTPEEAALPQARSFGFAGSLSEDGPEIKVQDIEAAAAQSGFPLVISFAAKEGQAVDLSTLRLECLKSTPVDLTPRIRSYAGSTGISIERISLPPGLYRFRLAIGDMSGKFSEKEFTVKVSVIF